LQEIAVQSHAALPSVPPVRFAALRRRRSCDHQPAGLTGLAASPAQRLRDANAHRRDDAAAIAKLLQVHPGVLSRTYVDLSVEVIDGDRCGSRSVRAPRSRRAIGLRGSRSLAAGPTGRSTRSSGRSTREPPAPPSRRRARKRFAYETVIDPTRLRRASARDRGWPKISTGATVTFTLGDRCGF